MADAHPIVGLSSIPRDSGRQGGSLLPRRRERAPAPPSGDEAAAAAEPVTEVPPAEDLAAPLIQALDRLRATHEVRPVDRELLRTLRGLRAYQDDQQHAGEPSPPGLPRDQIG